MYWDENVGHAIISASAEFHWWPTEVSHLSNFSNQSHSYKVLYAIASSQGHRGLKYLSGNSISSVMPVTQDQKTVSENKKCHAIL